MHKFSAIAAVSSAIVFLWATPARAATEIPYHLHGPDWTTWEADGDTGFGPVSHRHPVAAGENGDAAHQHYDAQAFLGPDPNGSFEPSGMYGVWINRTAFVDGDAPLFGEYATNGFGHGYINESSTTNLPRYKFIDDTGGGIPQAMKDRVNQAFSIWGSIAAQVSPTSGKQLSTGIAFVETTGAAYEIEIHWDDISDAANGGAAPIFAEGLYDKDSASRIKTTFDSNPAHEWDFTNTAGATQLDKMHFLSIALHEIGHLLFLEHSGDKDEDLMAPGATGVGDVLGDAIGSTSHRWFGLEEIAGEGDYFAGIKYERTVEAGAFSTTDISDLESVAAIKRLYSIPVPEPGTILLLVGGAGAIALRRRRR